MLKCGMSEVVITPPLGSHIPGHLIDRRSTGMKDELYAKALVVETKGTLMAMIVVDAVNLQRDQIQKIRERVSQFTPLRADQLMVSCTHTHTGPPVRPAFDGSMDEEYNIHLIKKSADAAIIAYHKRQAARLGCGSGHEDSIAFNRRFWMKDGTVQTNPGFHNSQLDRPAGPIDPQVLVVRIDDLNGDPIGVITNYACHTDTVGGTENCADFPGELSRMVKKALGEETVSLFVLGACGNINHHNFVNGERTGPEHYLKMGRILACEVLRVREKIDYFDTEHSDPAVVEQLYFTVPYRYPTEQEVKLAQHVLANESSSDSERFFAEHLLQVVDDPVDSARIEIQAFLLGDLAVVGLPGEIFVELGLSIKEGSPYPYTMVNTLCNGSTTGYVCTREAYEQGGYEPKLRKLNRNMPGNGELFAENAVKLLKRMQS